MEPQAFAVRVTHDRTVSETIGGGAINWHVLFVTELVGVADKRCECESCGQVFVYPMRRAGVGEGVALLGTFQTRAKRAAWDLAEAELERKLRSQHDPIPCIGCGHYQADMRRRMIRAKFGNPKPIANMLIVSGVVCLLFGLGCGVLTLGISSANQQPGPGALYTMGILIAFLFLGTGLLAAGITRLVRFERKVASHDPHKRTTVEERVQLARNLGAVTLDDYRELKRQKSKLEHPSERRTVPRPRPAPRVAEPDNPFDFG